MGDCVDDVINCTWLVVDCNCCAAVVCVVSGNICVVEAVIVVVFSPSDLVRRRKATLQKMLSLSCGVMLMIFGLLCIQKANGYLL